MDEMQAAFLDIKLKYVEAENRQRREVAACYCSNISNPLIVLPQSMHVNTIDDLSQVWHLFVIRTSNRNVLQQYLSAKGIDTLIHYPIPPHQQLAYKVWNNLNFPITEKIHHEVLSLPISPVMLETETEKVVETINRYSH